jgi:Resolvase, N terminal domain
MWFVVGDYLRIESGTTTSSKASTRSSLVKRGRSFWIGRVLDETNRTDSGTLRLPIRGDAPRMEKTAERTDVDVTSTTYVVRYVRMSSEHGEQSMESQLNAVRCYAQAHNMEIVGTFSDRDGANLRLVDK